MTSTRTAMVMEAYPTQVARWPRKGRHVMAQFDDESIVVYQAYRPEIGQFAAKHGYFGGEFSLSRMSWVKPNFLWMMYRSDWGTSEGQEVVLAVRMRRAPFDQILEAAVPSSFSPARYNDNAAWRTALAHSDVRLQWDPDHGPSGAPLERRAVQLGLRGDVLRSYSKEWILGIEDISDFCREQHARWKEGGDGALVTPREAPYPVTPAAAIALDLADA
jgi:hypothetical protein